MSPQPDQASVRASWLAGLVSGVLNAGLFNWWDKGLYESVKHKRPFLRIENFAHPWQGFRAAVGQRVLSYGMYFPIQETFEGELRKRLGSRADEHPEGLRLLASQLTGAAIALPLAPISVVKYRMWGSPLGYTASAAALWQEGGAMAFFRGIAPTLWRDCIWAATFSNLRFHGLAWARRGNENTSTTLDTNRRRNSSPRDGSGSSSASAGEQKNNSRSSSGVLAHSEAKATTTATSAAAAASSKSHGARQEVLEFALVAGAGAAATIISAPFNYSRNQVYATRAPAATPATWASIMKLVKETRTHPKPLPYLQQQLAVGWGTARVAVGMALGSSVYERSKSALEKVL